VILNIVQHSRGSINTCIDVVNRFDVLGLYAIQKNSQEKSKQKLEHG
jgi:hypothetical protein